MLKKWSVRISDSYSVRGTYSVMVGSLSRNTSCWWLSSFTRAYVPSISFFLMCILYILLKLPLLPLTFHWCFTVCSWDGFYISSTICSFVIAMKGCFSSELFYLVLNIWIILLNYIPLNLSGPKYCNSITTYHRLPWDADMLSSYCSIAGNESLLFRLSLNIGRYIFFVELIEVKISTI